MKTSKEEIKQMINEYRNAKYLVREVLGKLNNEIMHFEGTMLEAIDMGLVKPNFPMNKKAMQWRVNDMKK
jgi:hypothetical protein